MTGISFGDFVMDTAFIEEFRVSEATQAVLHAQLDRAVPIAQSMAPVQTGKYRDSIRGDVGVAEVPGVGPTAIGVLHADDWKAGFIEDGTVKQAPKRVLHRAAEAVGQ